jgi:hypothetical protein
MKYLLIAIGLFSMIGGVGGAEFKVIDGKIIYYSWKVETDLDKIFNKKDLNTNEKASLRYDRYADGFLAVNNDQLTEIQALLTKLQLTYKNIDIFPTQQEINKMIKLTRHYKSKQEIVDNWNNEDDYLNTDSMKALIKKINALEARVKALEQKVNP